MSDFLKAKPIFAEFDIYNGQNKCGMEKSKKVILKIMRGTEQAFNRQIFPLDSSF